MIEADAETPAGICRKLLPLWDAACQPNLGAWPDDGWRLCVTNGFGRWTIPKAFGGAGFTTTETLEGLLELSRGQLSLALILSQFQAAVSRIVQCENESLKSLVLPQLASGQRLATVGLSHLSTSRQHLHQPAVRLTREADGFFLDGETPWVTSATAADLLVTGGVDSAGQQWMFAVPMTNPQVNVGGVHHMVALTETCTAPVRFQRLKVTEDQRISGPAESVMKSKSGAGTGSLSTSAIALGHAFHAIDELARHPNPAGPIDDSHRSLEQEAHALRRNLLQASAGIANELWTTEAIRTATTSLALRSAQTFVAASRGAGFLSGHPAERLMREALFFLVWSCPQEVVGRMMQEFSRCSETAAESDLFPLQ